MDFRCAGSRRQSSPRSWSGVSGTRRPVPNLAAIAGKKAPVIWYESSPPEAVLKIAAVFNKKYPDIKLVRAQYRRRRHRRAHDPESEAGAATASSLIGDVAQRSRSTSAASCSRATGTAWASSRALPHSLRGRDDRRARRSGLEQAAGGGWRSAEDLGPDVVQRWRARSASGRAPRSGRWPRSMASSTCATTRAS